MVEIAGAIAVTFVEPRGTTAGEVGRVMGGVAGSTIASRANQGTSPLQKGQLGFLAVMPDRVVLFQAKRGAFKPKVTDTILAQAEPAAIAGAHLERKRLSGVLELAFVDGSNWSFEIPGVNLGEAQVVANVISPPAQ
jgi:hypothetical protein